MEIEDTEEAKFWFWRALRSCVFYFICIGLIFLACLFNAHTSVGWKIGLPIVMGYIATALGFIFEGFPSSSNKWTMAKNGFVWPRALFRQYKEEKKLKTTKL